MGGLLDCLLWVSCFSIAHALDVFMYKIDPMYMIKLDKP